MKVPALIMIRGEIYESSTLYIAMFYVAGITASCALFIGGEIFFRFSLKMTSNSTNCWLTFSKLGSGLSKADKLFFKSCRHISNSMGFCLITNPQITLIFFGTIVLKAVTDLLLAFRWSNGIYYYIISYGIPYLPHLLVLHNSCNKEENHCVPPKFTSIFPILGSISQGNKTWVK